MEVEKRRLDKVFLDEVSFRIVTGLVPVAKCGMSWDPETRQASCWKGTSRELCQDPHLLPVWTLHDLTQPKPSTVSVQTVQTYAILCYHILMFVYVPIGPFEAFEAFTCAS